MAKLRKMLGSITDESVIKLMKFIDTQSKETISSWSVEYVKLNILSIYENECDGDLRLGAIITATEKYLNGNIKLKEIKDILKESKSIPKEVEQNTIAQASARAILTACATIQTPSNALGFTFYAVAAIVYNQVGLNEKSETYDRIACNEYKKILESFKSMMIENEENPVKIRWNC